METLLRAALIQWLRDDPGLAGEINLIGEEAPGRASPPWLGIAASASTDWSTKDRTGRDVRVALELHIRGDAPEAAAAMTQGIERRVEHLPATQNGFEIANVRFLRARAEQRAGNVRAVLLEYRFRLLSVL
jgi:hypothetical protein